MARWSYLCSNFVFNYYKQRKRRSKVMEHMCFSASAASVYLHREWLLQPCLCYSVCIIALHLVLAAHTHTHTEQHLSDEALHKLQLWSWKDFIKNSVSAQEARLRKRSEHLFNRTLNFSTLSLANGVFFRAWLKALPLIVSICQSIVWMRSPITDMARGQLDFSWFNWIYDMSQIQTSRDCFAVTASLLHIKNSFQNGLWLCGCKCWKGMKSNKWLYFWEDYCTSLRMWEGRNSTRVLLSVNGSGCLLG